MVTLKQKVMMSFMVVIAAGIFVSDGYSAKKKYDLKLNLKKGQKLGMKIVNDQKISQTVMGQQQKMNQMMAMGISFEVLAVDSEGNMSTKTTYQTIHVKMEGPMGVMEYDSAKPEETESANPISAMYKAMLGQSIVMKMTPKGEILAIENLEEMITKMADQMAADDAKKQQMREMMKSFINEDKMKEMGGAMTAALPQQLVSVGESWTNQISIPVGFPMEMDTTNTLTECKGGIFTIQTEARIEPGDQAKPIEMGGVKMSMRIQGQQNGTSQLDEATGWMVRSKADMKFSGEVKVEGNEQMPQGMTIPMSIEGVTTIEPVAVK
ncbi:MAG: DUF6263 family protein [Planctomycetota bacterium]|jgi:hypothetical protein